MNKEKMQLIDKLFINSKNELQLKPKEITLFEPKSFEEMIKINKKTEYRIKVSLLESDFKTALKLLNKVIERYKELYNKTEYYEAESTYDYNFNDWNTIKKANGKLARYYNDLRKIYIQMIWDDVPNIKRRKNERK